MAKNGNGTIKVIALVVTVCTSLGLAGWRLTEKIGANSTAIATNTARLGTTGERLDRIEDKVDWLVRKQGGDPDDLARRGRK